MKLTVPALAVLACVLFSVTDGVAIHIQPRCRCTTTQNKPIRVERIQRFEHLAPGPHCKTLQVIAVVKFKKVLEVCVNPSDQWVKDAMNKLEEKLSSSTNTTEAA